MFTICGTFWKEISFFIFRIGKEQRYFFVYISCQLGWWKIKIKSNNNFDFICLNKQIVVSLINLLNKNKCDDFLRLRKTFYELHLLIKKRFLKLRLFVCVTNMVDAASYIWYNLNLNNRPFYLHLTIR
jgi:hypothetical protein